MALITGTQLTNLITANGFDATAELLQAYGTWLKEGARLTGDFPRASATLGRALTDDDKLAIRGKLTEWLAREPSMAAILAARGQ